ncbi:MAG: restriction endonuclease subunit S [Rikenellaceae bacterium]
MRSNYSRLGDYIREVNVRNRKLEVTKLLGVSIQKRFIPSIANTIGTDMSTYKIVTRGQFAYGPVTSRNGDKVSIALLSECDSAIISQAYTVFEVIDNSELLPEYLMMWFMRPEFDRYARYKSHGSAREIFDWSEMCDVELPIPLPEKQRAIVKEYQTLTDRIKLNETLCTKLEQTAQALYRKMFIDNIDSENLPDGWRMGTIGDIGKVITGKTPSSQNPEDFGYDMMFVSPSDFKNNNKFIFKTDRMLSKSGYMRLSNKIISPNNLLVTCIGSDMGKVKITDAECVTNQQINAIILNSHSYLNYLYYLLNKMSSELKSMALGSSTMPMLSKSEFERIKFLIPNDKIVYEFNGVCSKINNVESSLLKENSYLYKIKSMLLSKISTIN